MMKKTTRALCVKKRWIYLIKISFLAPVDIGYVETLEIILSNAHY